MTISVSIKAHHSSWGWVGIAASNEGLLGLTLPRISKSVAMEPLLRRFPGARQGGTALTAALVYQLDRYFAEQEVDFRGQMLDLHLCSRFQSLVWQVVRGIPRGQVRSYRWVAVQADSPRGARAVGRAMAMNPFPIVVPCHRVVGRQGQLTGFGGGLDLKRRLLELEAVPTTGTRVLTAVA